MDDRIALAKRRKELHEKSKLFAREQQKEQKEKRHDKLVEKRRAVAKTGQHPEAAEYENYFCASGSGTAWRAREHVSLKCSPRNLRKGAYVNQHDDPKWKKEHKTVPKKISDEQYYRLTYRDAKQSDAVAEELLIHY